MFVTVFMMKLIRRWRDITSYFRLKTKDIICLTLLLTNSLNTCDARCSARQNLWNWRVVSRYELLLGRIEVLRCGLLLQMEYRGLSVGLSRSYKPCKNCSTDWDTVWNVDSGGPKETCSRWGPDPYTRMGNLRGWSGRPRTCPAVDVLKATQQGAAPVRCGCRLGCTMWMHIGAIWGIRLNRPCAVAMRPHVKLRWASVIMTTTVTRHRASTSMYSLTFWVRVMSPERHHWKPAVQAAAVMLRTPPSTASHRPSSHAHLRYTACNFENTPSPAGH